MLPKLYILCNEQLLQACAIWTLFKKKEIKYCKVTPKLFSFVNKFQFETSNCVVRLRLIYNCTLPFFLQKKTGDVANNNISSNPRTIKRSQLKPFSVYQLAENSQR
jgi:hypothetical protein